MLAGDDNRGDEVDRPVRPVVCGPVEQAQRYPSRNTADDGDNGRLGPRGAFQCHGDACLSDRQTGLIQRLPAVDDNSDRSVVADQLRAERGSAYHACVLRLRVAAPGTYEFFCSVPGHRGGGMRGTLVVR